MPPKRGMNKKVKKLANAEVFNNGEKEVAKELSDANIVQNGASPNDAEVVHKLKKLKTTKEGRGRPKNATVELDIEAPPAKKLVAKGRGKIKVVENEDMESEVNDIKLENQEGSKNSAIEIKRKSKAKDVGKKAEPKAERNTKAKENKKVSSSGEGLDTIKEEVELPERNIKSVSGRKKGKQVEEQIDVKQEILKTLVEEKVAKKLRNSEKIKEENPEIESQKKKGKILKKEKVFETNKSDLKVGGSSEVKDDKNEKKPVKRGRPTTKAAVTTEDRISSNGDTNKVLPKKRSRKASSAEKDEKPKRGRARKADKAQNISEDGEVSM